MKEIIIAINLLSGVVVDSETKEPIPAARVEILNEIQNKDIYTDFDGNFKLDSLSDSTKIRISFISYEDKVLTYEDIKNNSFINLSSH